MINNNENAGIESGEGAQRVRDDFGDIRFDVRDAAKEMAAGALREQNKREWVAELTVTGDTRLVAGCTIRVEDFGVFDGVYIIESAEHRISGDGGYTTSIKARRALEGY